MDSLTQFVLGAAVSTVCLGPKVGPRKAALIGGVLGTIPDLDVFIPFPDPIDSFVYHRGWTHSVFVHLLAAPVIGEIVFRLFKGLREHRWLVWATVFLCFSTHAIIDAMTIYGTRLFWPFYPDPVGVGSVFIIDPLYTLPLLVAVVWALFRKDWTRRFGRWAAAALIATTGYLGLSVALQAHAESRAGEVFAKAGIKPDRVIAIASPFNTVVWKVIGLENGTYHNVYLSLFDGDADPKVYSHTRRADLLSCVASTDAFEKLEWFSRGFYKAEELDGKIVMSDLRMGMTPAYVFRFAIAEHTDSGTLPIPPKREMAHRVSSDGDLDWLGERLLGRPSVRAAEKDLGLQPGPATESAC